MTRSFCTLLLVCLAVAVPMYAQGEKVLPSNPVSSGGLADAPSATLASPASSETNLLRPSDFTLTAGSRLALLRSTLPSSDFAEESGVPKPMPRPVRSVATPTYWAVNSMLAGSFVANAETLVGCPNCTHIPASMHRRGVTYSVGIPATAAVSYLGYYLKKNGHHYWFAPAAVLTAANAFLAYHWAVSTN